MTTSGGVLFSVVSFLTVVSFFAMVVNIMMKSKDCTVQKVSLEAEVSGML